MDKVQKLNSNEGKLIPRYLPIKIPTNTGTEVARRTHKHKLKH
jgi:hypothetical protein